MPSNDTSNVQPTPRGAAVSPATRRRDRRAWLRWLILLGITCGTVAASLWGILWWEERPLRRAVALLEAGDARQALSELDEFIAARGASDRALAMRARVLVALGRPAEAIRLFERVGAERTEEIHAWARAWLHLQQWAHALPLLEEVRRRDPHNADVLHELTSCRARLGRLDEALESAHEFVKHEEYAHRGWLLIGTLLRDQGNKSQAAEAWSRVGAFDPDFDDLQVPADEFLTQFASLQLDLGEPSRAAALLRTALSKKETAEARSLLGVAEEQLGNQTAASSHWQRVLELDPGHVQTRESLARLAISAGDPGRAEDLLKPVLHATSPRSSTTYLMQRAAYLQGDEPAAETWREKTEALREAEAIDATIAQMLRESPDSYWAHVVRCYQFAADRNWRQAEALLESLPSSPKEHQFVAELREAVRNRGPLPSKELLPIASF